MASHHLIIQHATELKGHFLSPKWTEQKNFLHREPVRSWFTGFRQIPSRLWTESWIIDWLSWLDLEAREKNLGCELWIMARILVCMCVSPWRHSQFQFPTTDRFTFSYSCSAGYISNLIISLECLMWKKHLGFSQVHMERRAICNSILKHFSLSLFNYTQLDFWRGWWCSW